MGFGQVRARFGELIENRPIKVIGKSPGRRPDLSGCDPQPEAADDGDRGDDEASFIVVCLTPAFSCDRRPPSDRHPLLGGGVTIGNSTGHF